MAKQLKNIFVTGSDAISQGFTINAKHVSQSVEAFTSQEAYDISISGSQKITGSFIFLFSKNSSSNARLICYYYKCLLILMICVKV